MVDGPGNIFIQLLIIVLLTFVNAFFSASEMAIISVSRVKINHMASEGHIKAELLVKLLNEPSKFLATTQAGITLAGFLASAFAASSLTDKFAAYIAQYNIPGSTELALVSITIALSFLTLVLGELFPKRLALQHAEPIALAAIKPLVFVSKVAAPFVKLLTLVTNLLVRLFGVNTDKLEEHVSEEEIRLMINVGEETGVINETEKEMIDGIFEFDDTLAKEIMTPRTSVFCIDVNTPYDVFMDKILDEQYSRIPVFESEIDNIIGVLYMKDLFKHIRHCNTSIDIRQLIRPATFVPETKNIDTLFKEFKTSKNHMVFLIDEYGGFSGIVTIEDVIEEVMGNIFDEYDENDDDIRKLEDNKYLVNGLTLIDDLNNALSLRLPSENFDTIGGFVIDILGSIPNDDDHHSISYENLVFTIENVEEKRVDKVIITINPKEEQEVSEEE